MIKSILPSDLPPPSSATTSSHGLQCDDLVLTVNGLAADTVDTLNQVRHFADKQLIAHGHFSVVWSPGVDAGMLGMVVESNVPHLV